MKYHFLIVFIAIYILTACSFEHKKDEAYTDARYQDGIQCIPGQVQCEYYDIGGEGIAYHDSDSINSGSGRLNPADGSYLNEFRMSEAVDISYTKFTEPAIDNSIYNFVDTQPDQLYLGWTEPGEWVNYTINVTKSGTYNIGFMYTANQDAKVALAIDSKTLGGQIAIPSTYVEADSLQWRQWHHWNYLNDALKVELSEGIHQLTLSIEETGQMNFDYIDFKLLQ